MHLFILSFCIGICSFVNNHLNNVNIPIWNLIKQHMLICQLHVMLKSINLCQRIIMIWRNVWRVIYIYFCTKTKKNWMFSNYKTLLHSNMKLRHEKTWKSPETLFHFIPFNKNVKWSISRIVVMMITNGPYTWFR